MFRTKIYKTCRYLVVNPLSVVEQNFATDAPVVAATNKFSRT